MRGLTERLHEAPDAPAGEDGQDEIIVPAEEVEGLSEGGYEAASEGEGSEGE
jgi:hypothetical protein